LNNFLLDLLNIQSQKWKKFRNLATKQCSSLQGHIVGPLKNTNKQILTPTNNSLKKIQQEGTLIFL
jgi:hypothetical protein